MSTFDNNWERAGPALSHFPLHWFSTAPLAWFIYPSHTHCVTYTLAHKIVTVAHTKRTKNEENRTVLRTTSFVPWSTSGPFGPNSLLLLCVKISVSHATTFHYAVCTELKNNDHTYQRLKEDTSKKSINLIVCVNVGSSTSLPPPPPSHETSIPSRSGRSCISPTSVDGLSYTIPPVTTSVPRTVTIISGFTLTWTGIWYYIMINFFAIRIALRNAFVYGVPGQHIYPIILPAPCLARRHAARTANSRSTFVIFLLSTVSTFGYQM